jgi:hypothetical protein
VDPRSGLNAAEKKKFLTISVLEPRLPPVVQPVASRYTYCVNPALQNKYMNELNKHVFHVIPQSGIYLEKIIHILAVQNILLYSREVHYCIDKNPSPTSVLSKPNPFHIFTSYFFRIHFPPHILCPYRSSGYEETLS